MTRLIILAQSFPIYYCQLQDRPFHIYQSLGKSPSTANSFQRSQTLNSDGYYRSKATLQISAEVVVDPEAPLSR